jgi:hypothetical protein
VAGGAAAVGDPGPAVQRHPGQGDAGLLPAAPGDVAALLARLDELGPPSFV